VAVIKYRSCSIDGQRADALLAFRSNLAGITATVQSEIDKLNGTVRPVGQGNQEVLQVDQPTESVTLVGQEPVDLAQVPVGPVQVTQFRNQSGQVYRQYPRYLGTVQPGQLAPAKYGLYGTVDHAAAQWNFTNETQDGPALDASPYGRTALPVGVLPVGSVGPLGTSRQFGPGYLRIPTGLAVGDASQSGFAWRHDAGAWAWIRLTDLLSERPVLAFASPATTTLAGQVVSMTGGPDSYALTCTGTSFGTLGFARVRDRLALGQDPNLYEITAVADAQHVTVVPLDPGQSSTVLPGDQIVRGGELPGLPDRYSVPPEARNTLFGLSVVPDGRVRAYWHVRQGQPVEAFGPAVTAGADWFVGFQRRERTVLKGQDQPARWSANGSHVITNLSAPGFDANGALQAGQWVRLDHEDEWRRIVAIDPAGPGQTIQLDTRTAVWDASLESTLKTLRVMVHAGNTAGSFQTVTTDGLPGPSGGTDAIPGNSGLTGNTVVCRGELQVGRDARTNDLFAGTMDAVTVFTVALDTEESGDEGFRRHWALAFPDYLVDGQKISRTNPSDIPDGATVWPAYRYETHARAAQSTLDRLDRATSGVLGSLGASTTTTDQLAGAIGAPVPSDQDNTERMAQQFGQAGLLVQAGRIVVAGTTDLTAYAALCRTVGVPEADRLLDRPVGSFILIALTQDVQDVAAVDSCGVPSVTTVVTDRVVGIDQTLWQAALAAGFQNVDQLLVRLWWVGESRATDAAILQLRALGLSPDQITACITVQSTDRLEVRVVPVGVGPGLRALGLDVDQVVNRPDESLPLVNLRQTPGQVANRYLEFLNGSPGQTVDGDPNPRNPGLELARIVDLGRLFPPVPVDTADQDCAAIAQALTDAVACVVDVMNRVQAACVPLQLHQAATIGTSKLAVQRYIPCVANVSLTAALPEFHVRLDQLNALFGLIARETTRIGQQVQSAADQARTALCVPRTLIAALRGGVCGIEQPKEISNRSCPPAIDQMIDQIERLLAAADLTLTKIAEAASLSQVDAELGGGAASELLVDATIPCVGPVAQLLRTF
jgi:hypothetical protein